MIEKIQKRSGETVAFDATKIRSAMYRANIHTEDRCMTEDELDLLTLQVVQRAEALGGIPTVEQIQDLVEEVLVAADYAGTAKAYMLYRAEHTTMRYMNADLMKTYENLTFTGDHKGVYIRTSTNVGHNTDTAMGTMLKYGSEGAKAFYDRNVIPGEIAAAHDEGDLHIHDKDFYALTETNCQIDLLELFDSGFSTGHGYLRTPNSIRSYAALCCIAIQANQNDMHGGQSIPNFDYAMAPGVRKTFRKSYRWALMQHLQISLEKTEAEAQQLLDPIKDDLDTVRMGQADEILPTLRGVLEGFSPELPARAHAYAVEKALRETENATYQAMEALIHNLNTMTSRAGAQVPFSTVNYGTDTSPEGRMVMRNMLLATEKGLGDGSTPVYPVQIFKVKNGVNAHKGDPNYDLFRQAMQVSALRLYPNFSFLDAPFNLPYYREGDYRSEVAYLGCRTRVMENVYDPSRQTSCRRGNLSFTTINLPRLALLADGDLDTFFSLLNDRMDLALRQLRHRLGIQGTKKVYNFPFLMEQGVWMDAEALSMTDSVQEVLKHGTLSVGFIGLAETLTALTGSHHGESMESQKLGLSIIGHMRARLDRETRQTGLNWGLFATPAETLCGRFTELDKKRFGTVPGVTDRSYYTNSLHIPVWYSISVWEKIEREAPYHALTNNGHITCVELTTEQAQDTDLFERILLYMQQCGIGYGAINHAADRDPECGYIGEIGEICPYCRRSESEGRRFERIRRITSYLAGPLENWNPAKRDEERDRVKHRV